MTIKTKIKILSFALLMGGLAFSSSSFAKPAVVVVNAHTVANYGKDGGTLTIYLYGGGNANFYKQTIPLVMNMNDNRELKFPISDDTQSIYFVGETLVAGYASRQTYINGEEQKYIDVEKIKKVNLDSELTPSKSGHHTLTYSIPKE